MNKIKIITHKLESSKLKRIITIDCYTPDIDKKSKNHILLLINDGQDLAKMKFEQILEDFSKEHEAVFLPVGIHASNDRIEEYGTAGIPDYRGRGQSAASYQHFLIDELIPFLENIFPQLNLNHRAIAGFSMGGLCAIDTLWNHPDHFNFCGVFSGSLWWRDKDHLDKDYRDDTNRIMHRKIKEGKMTPNKKFFFQAGCLDEKADRNNNGVIDSIDDTLDLMQELNQKGYSTTEDMFYLELEDGRHDVITWGKAMPHFLLWLHQFQHH
jgi:predicted alpha/beta superfamily hydrolase